jgi:AcrR family transcriptional regulator
VRAAKHRHAVDTGYARGEETRARIITAALKMFGERGFEGASTRDIATVAGVNAPALQYYFDSKEGVYVACVEYIMGRVWNHMSGVVERAETALAEGADDEDLIRAFCAIQTHMAEFMFTARDAADWRLFMARLQAGEGPPAAFHVIHEGMKKRMANATSTIVGRLLGRPADDEETLIRTMALMGPLTVFQCSPRSFMARMNWDVIDEKRLTLLTRVIREQTATLLRSVVAARPTASSRRAVRSNTRLVRG